MALILFLIASLLLISTKGSQTAVPAPAPVIAPIPIKTPPPSSKAPTPAPVLTPPSSTVTPRPLIKNRSECGPQCSDRCSLHSRPNVCLRACNTCCQRCLCVPPGTSGNKEVCKCYANMTTKGGRSKCP